MRREFEKSIEDSLEKARHLGHDPNEVSRTQYLATFGCVKCRCLMEVWRFPTQPNGVMLVEECRA